MAVYVICPHCLHPTVVSRGHTGKGRYCRQCSEVFFVGASPSLAADTVPVRSTNHLALLQERSARGLGVYELA